jgi:hypothetical protein
MKPSNLLNPPKVHYVYLIEDKGTGMRYIGSHFGTTDDGYLGSGKLIKAAVKERPSDFVKSTLGIYPDKSSCRAAEADFIGRYNTLWPAGYNTSPTGGTHRGGVHSLLSRELMSVEQIIAKHDKKRKRAAEQKAALEDPNNIMHGRTLAEAGVEIIKRMKEKEL